MINPTKDLYLSSNQGCDRLFKEKSVRDASHVEDIPLEALLGDEAYINALRMRPVGDKGANNEE